MGGVTVTSLNRDRVVIIFQKMQELPSKTFTLGDYFRDGIESPNMGTKMYGFPKENHDCRCDLA